MAGSHWTCARCGTVNDVAAGQCAVCAEPAPPPGPHRARAWWALLILVLVAGAVVGGTFLFASRHRSPPAPAAQFPLYTTPVLPPSTTLAASPSTAAPPLSSSPTTTTTATEKPCPDAAAQYLPGGAGTGLLVAQTAKSVITICQTPDGQVFYDGQARGQAASASTHLALPAQRSGDGFVAVNGDYRYAVGSERLVVSQDGNVLSDDPLTPVG